MPPATAIGPPKMVVNRRGSENAADNAVRNDMTINTGYKPKYPRIN